MFDESYYVVDGIDVIRRGVTDRFQAHPPLGTWLIGIGVSVVDGPIGWRLTALVAGVMTVVALHRLSGRLLPTTPTGRLLAAAGPALLMTDGSWLVLSRAGVLDGPLTALTTAAVASAVASMLTPDAPRRRWWLLATGLAVGAATAVKWSGAFAGIAVLGVLVALDQTPQLRARVLAGVTRSAAVAAIALLTYGVTWIPFAVQRDEVEITNCFAEAAPCAEDGGLSGVVEQHRSLVRYHTRIVVFDRGETAPALWPLMQSSIGFFRPGCNVTGDPYQVDDDSPYDCDSDIGPGEDTIRYVGNPVVWIGFLVLVPVTAVGARRGDRLAIVALIGWTAQWVPWLAATRSSFLWYMAPTIPFAALGLVAGARRIPDGGLPYAVVTGLLGATAGGLVGVILPVGSVAGAIIGWGLGPLALGKARSTATSHDAADPSTSAVGIGHAVAVGAAVTAAVVTAVIMRPTWTVDPDSPVDRQFPPSEADTTD